MTFYDCIFQEGGIWENCFVKPATDPSVQGYNIVNTLAYGIILLILSFWVLYPQLKKRGIQFDYKFMLALLPYIAFGISLRAINAARWFYPTIQQTVNPFELGYWTHTPGVWFATAVLTLIGLGIGLKFGKEKYHTIFAGIGLLTGGVLFAYVLSRFVDWTNFGLAVGVIAVTIIVTWFVVQKVLKKKVLENKLNILALTGQVIDSGATFLAVGFLGYGEQHPLSAFILGVNPALFIVVKVVLIVAILHYIDQDIQDENLKGFIKLFLAILGFATGGASLIKIGAIGVV
ncbi:MAG: DUF63 family protein [Candidatus Diapherotrites archaeon]|nr:DUF63 family protein [Candidatus Diapherotrites archaeon]